MVFTYDPKEEKLIIKKSSRIEYNQLKIWLTRYVKSHRYMPAFKMGVWDGQTSYFDNGKVSLGLWKECLKACREIGAEFIIENKEDFPINRDVTIESVREFCNDFFSGHKVLDQEKKEWVEFKPYDYQIETVFRILKNRYCMAEIATSGGKSLVISIVIFYTLKKIDPNAKFLIIVPSILLVNQFYEDFMEANFGVNFLHEFKNKVDFSQNLIDDVKEKYPSYNPCHIKMEEVMSEKPRKWVGTEDPNIYIGTYQSLEKWPKEFFKQFHTVACDESHFAKSNSLKKILTNTFKHAYNRFGVSGTFPPDDSLEILSIRSVLGPNINNIKAKELVDSGKITPMMIRSILMDHDSKLINDQLYKARKMGGGKEAFQYEKDLVHSSQKRLDFIKKLVDKCPSNTIVLFYTIEYGIKILNKLKEEIPDKDFYYIDGSISGKERNSIKSEMEKTDGRVKILVGSYGCLSTGISIKAITNIIFADSFKSEQIIIQSIGRALRKHGQKKVANIFDLVDILDSSKMNNSLYRHYIERKKFYKEREYPYKEIKISL
jgi:superfamily II DNA or RNA helicase